MIICIATKVIEAIVIDKVDITHPFAKYISRGFPACKDKQKIVHVCEHLLSCKLQFLYLRISCFTCSVSISFSSIGVAISMYIIILLLFTQICQLRLIVFFCYLFIL